MSQKRVRALIENSAVIYCRVSTKEQVENLSLGSQEKICREFCKKHGYEVAKVFIEKGESARSTAREELQQMLTYCCSKKGLVSRVVFYDLTRFSRLAVDFHSMKALLAKYGVIVTSATEAFDESPAGNFMQGVIVQMGQFENECRSVRTKVGMRAAVEAGRWPSKAPLGYLQGGKQFGCSIRLDPKMAPILRQAFEMVGSGAYTANEALRRANSLGLRTSKGKEVNPQSFNYTLRKRVYSGWIVWKGCKPVRGDFEPLVNQELFDRVQLVLSGRKSGAKTHARSHPDFPLRRFVRCGNCSKPLTASWSTGRKDQYPYYRCRGCKQVNARKEVIEAAFTSFLQCLKPRDSFLRLFEAVVMDVWKTKQADAVALIASCEGQLEALLDKRDNLDEAFLYQKKISQETYDRQHERIQVEIVAQQIAISEMKIDEIEVETVITFARHLLENARNLWLKASPDQKEKLQKVLFPEGVTYKEGKFGTNVTGSVYSMLDQSFARKSKMATRHGFEP